MKRSPLPPRTKRPRQMSARKRRTLGKEARCREIVERRAHGLCEACERLHSGPRRRGTDKHEILTRARGGDATDPRNCLWVCRPCHEWIGRFPERASELGLLRHSWERDPLRASKGISLGFAICLAFWVPVFVVIVKAIT